MSVNTVNEFISGIFFYTDYMNVDIKGQSSSVSEGLNLKYEDLSQVRVNALPSSSKSFIPVPKNPEYQNTAQGSLLLVATESCNNLSHEMGFLPQATTGPTVNTWASNGNKFFPAAENLEYLGLGASVPATIH